MAEFECRHAEWHDDSDWREVKAYDAESAAVAFAKRMDACDSEMFQRPDADFAMILVRKLGSTEHEVYRVDFDYYKSFSARRERVAAASE